VPPTRRWHFADRSIRLLGYRVPSVVGPRSPRLRRSRKRSRSRRTRRRDSEPGRSSRRHQRHQRLDVRPPLGVQRGLPGVAKQEHALPPAARCSCRKQSRSLETRPAVSWKSSEATTTTRLPQSHHRRTDRRGRPTTPLRYKAVTGRFGGCVISVRGRRRAASMPVAVVRPVAVRGSARRGRRR
jgi:hypothetical protein